MTLRRARPYWARKKGGGQFPFITNNAFDSFGFIKIYDTAEVNCLNLLRPSDSANKDIPWEGNKINKAEILNFGDLSGNDSVRKLYAQKNAPVDLVSEDRTLTSGKLLQVRDEFDFSMGAIGTSEDIQPYILRGSLANGIRRNTPFFACTYLFKSFDSTQTLFNAILSNGLTGSFINITANGYTIGGRRIQGQSNQSISSTGIDPEVWRVVTAIWDFGNRELILRVDGAQEAISTTFQDGGNSEDSDSSVVVFLGNRDSGDFGVPGEFAHATFWNTPVLLSEIQEVENYYLDIKAILP